MCTGSSARVRSVIAASAACGSRLSVTRVDVREHRPRALVDRGVGRGDERERARDDLIALPHADRAQRQVQPGGAAADGARDAARRRARRTAARTRATRGPSESCPERSTSITACSSASPSTRPGERDRLALPLSPAAARSRERSSALAASLRAPARRPGCMPYSSESTSASHEAAITFSETPIVPHTSCPSEASISTRVIAPVPFVSSRMRTLKLTSSMSRRCGWISPIASRSAASSACTGPLPSAVRT